MAMYLMYSIHTCGGSVSKYVCFLGKTFLQRFIVNCIRGGDTFICRAEYFCPKFKLISNISFLPYFPKEEELFCPNEGTPLLRFVGLRVVHCVKDYKIKYTRSVISKEFLHVADVSVFPIQESSTIVKPVVAFWRTLVTLYIFIR